MACPYFCIQIILHIHLLSTSSTFPYASRYIKSCIQSSSTPSYRAKWLITRLAREGYSPSSASPTSPGGSNATSYLSASASSRRRKARTASSFSSHQHDDTSTSTNRHANDSDSAFLNKALKYPICNLDTIRILEGICLEALNARLQDKWKEEHLKRIAKVKLNGHPTHQSLSFMNTNNTHHHRKGMPIQTRKHMTIEQMKEEHPPPPYPTFLPIPPRSIDIPKRLFRNLPSTAPPSSSTSMSSESLTLSIPDGSLALFESQDLPYIMHLLSTLQANPNSARGYPLAKAVLARHVPLICTLLEYGADPTTKDYMAVMLAVGRRDLDIVRLLVERYDDSRSSIMQTHSGIPSSSTFSGRDVEERGLKRKRRRTEKNGGDNSSLTMKNKKRRLEDRFQITSEMLELAVKQKSEGMIQYFMSKGEVWIDYFSREENTDVLSPSHLLFDRRRTQLEDLADAAGLDWRSICPPLIRMLE